MRPASRDRPASKSRPDIAIVRSLVNVVELWIPTSADVAQRPVICLQICTPCRMLLPGSIDLLEAPSPSERGLFIVKVDRMDDYISTAEAAQILGITPRRILVLIAEGRIKSKKIGRTHIVEARSVASFQPRPEGRPGHRKSKEQK